MKIVFNMPEQEYFAVEAFSASMAKNMLRSPLEAWHYSWFNKDRKDETTPAMLIGKAYHKAVLEGVEEFYDSYCSEPLKEDHPNALASHQDAKDFLKEIGEKSTGLKTDLMAKSKTFGAVIWDELKEELIDGRTYLSHDNHERIISARGLLEESKDLCGLFSEGHAEVSFFWEEVGVKFKCRMDNVKPGFVTDLKTFSPLTKRPIREAAIQAVVNENYGVQTVQYLRAMSKAYEAHKEGNLEVIGGEFTPQKVNKFTFIFLRTGAIQDIIPLEYGPVFTQGGNTIQHNEYFKRSIEKWQYAVTNFKHCVETFGSRRWKMYDEITSLNDQDFPIYAL